MNKLKTFWNRLTHWIEEAMIALAIAIFLILLIVAYALFGLFSVFWMILQGLAKVTKRWTEV